MAERRETLEAVDADIVLAATPIHIGALLQLGKPATRVRYELAQVGGRPLAVTRESQVQGHFTPARSGRSVDAGSDGLEGG